MYDYVCVSVCGHTQHVLHPTVLVLHHLIKSQVPPVQIAVLM